MRIHGHVTRLPELPAPAGSEAAPGRACPSREVRVLGLGTRPGQEVGSGHHGGCCHWLTRSSVPGKSFDKAKLHRGTVVDEPPESSSSSASNAPEDCAGGRNGTHIRLGPFFTEVTRHGAPQKGRAGCLETSTASSMFLFSPLCGTQLPSTKNRRPGMGRPAEESVLFFPWAWRRPLSSTVGAAGADGARIPAGPGWGLRCSFLLLGHFGGLQRGWWEILLCRRSQKRS